MAFLFLSLFSFLLSLQSSVQLQCAPKKVQAAIGGSFTLVCNYETKPFLFSKKYWCLGESRSTCEILMDTDGFTKRELKGRIQIHDARKNGLFVVMTDLRLADTGHYWVGIDKIYADLMSPISITVSEVAVSQPRLRFLGPLSGTCWGRPLTVWCASDQGTNVHYGWYRAGGVQVIPQGVTTHLQLHCGVVRDSEQYYCEARNSVSSERSRSVSVLLLRPAEEDCVYILTVEGEHQYDCWDRLRTSTALPQDTTEARSFVNQSTAVNHTEELGVFIKARYGIPVWYEVLRWLLMASLLTSLCLVHRCHRGQCRRVRGICASS
ncbi:uncharacterized protein LOC118208596 [Anguilla anguilla]|uniref:uncharacterized protein LOC118208596 n=1 Tax=Anguilla anguilla TaxID=7936 RepID=UPI0015AEC11C|nr:uncharacterized protein LOC118208596 [Anguilla anguilla]